MTASRQTGLRVFFDPSAIIAGALSQRGSSYILLQMSALGVLDGRYSPDVREEAVPFDFDYPVRAQASGCRHDRQQSGRPGRQVG